MKGILLAGGSGTRLRPLTRAVNKHFLPVYDKPMIYYSLSTLMLAGIREILIICRPQDKAAFIEMLGDGSQWGIELSYATQENANGIAEAFIIGKDFIGNNPSALVLGDNIFFGHGFGTHLAQARSNTGATVFGVYVPNPDQFGVVVRDADENVIDLIEKPTTYVSNYAVPGLYFYDNQVCDVAANLKPSTRGELEITDVNKWYLQNDTLNVISLQRGFAWYDTGTPEAMLDAATFIAGVDKRQGLRIACPEEIAYWKGWITPSAMEKLADDLKKTGYGHYLQRVLKEKKVNE